MVQWDDGTKDDEIDPRMGNFLLFDNSQTGELVEKYSTEVD
jgi:hypothetical protein